MIEDRKRTSVALAVADRSSSIKDSFHHLLRGPMGDIQRQITLLDPGAVTSLAEEEGKYTVKGDVWISFV